MSTKQDCVTKIGKLQTRRKTIDDQIERLRAEMKSQLETQLAAIQSLGDESVAEQTTIDVTKKTLKGIDWRMIAILIAIPILLFLWSRWEATSPPVQKNVSVPNDCSVAPVSATAWPMDNPAFNEPKSPDLPAVCGPDGCPPPTKQPARTTPRRRTLR